MTTDFHHPTPRERECCQSSAPEEGLPASEGQQRASVGRRAAGTTHVMIRAHDEGRLGRKLALALGRTTRLPFLVKKNRPRFSCYWHFSPSSAGKQNKQSARADGVPATRAPLSPPPRHWHRVVRSTVMTHEIDFSHQRPGEAVGTPSDTGTRVLPTTLSSSPSCPPLGRGQM